MTAVRSKTLATWLAVAAGALGMHRFYLHGWRDRAGWLFPLPTLMGLVGVARMRHLGQDDLLSWFLIPWLGLSISAAMVSAIVIGLTSDETWARRFGGTDPDNRAETPASTGWSPVLGVIVALLLGGVVLMGTIAFGGQKYFEWRQLQQATTS